ncbi:MAG: RNA polymerase sigma factor RpoS [Legionellales bacterium]|jgi:RNA polymerase nonessential primary-like sigma factor|nr:RNA polymerase sigma factor RpoS [Legionellales bacterium]
MVHSNVNGKTSTNEAKHASTSSDPVVTYLNAISGFRSLTKEEEFALFTQYKNGDDDAYNTIVESNLRLVVKVARRYFGRGIAMLDLIEEGNLGLLHAIKKFEVERGFRFSTYSIWWIKQYIERAIMNQSRQIRLPVHVIKKLTSYLNAGSKMGKSGVENVSAEEIASHFDVEVDQVQHIMKYKLDTKSLDDTGYSDSDVSLSNVVEDPKSLDPLEIVGNESTKALLDEWLDKLDELDYQVIIHRYGLEGHDAKTLEEVGAVVGLTRERVRQIQIRALSRMRRSMNFSGIDISEADMGKKDA